MAESLGVAASVAGLLGLCGQIVQGCLFLKDFIEGARDAPEDIRLLLIEIQILSAAACETKDAIEQLSDLGLESKVDTYEAALKQCHELLSSVVIRVTTNSSNLKRAGRLKWWYQLNISAQRKTLDAMMHRLERAKTQVQMVQSNICLALHRNHYLLSSSLSGKKADSTRTISTAMIFDKISGFEETVANLTSSVLPSASQSLEKIGHIEAHLRRLEKLSGGHGSNPVPNSLARSTPEWSTMHHVIYDAVETALKDHFHDTDVQVYDADSAASSEKDTVAINELPREISENSGFDVEAPSNRPRNQLLPRSLMTTKFTYGNSFFDVEVTKNSSPENQDPDVSIAANERGHGLHFISPESKSTTSLHVRLRLPFWHKGLVVDSASSPYPCESRIGLNLTTYNILPATSAIFQAAKKLDIQTVHDLFRTGCASPWDRTIEGESLVEFVLHGLIFYLCSSNETHRDSTKVRTSLELVELLTNICPANHCSCLVYFDFINIQQMANKITPQFQELCGRALRIYLENLSSDPFDDFPLVHLLESNLAENYLYQIVSKQQTWNIDFDTRDHPWYPNIHVENARQMLLDPRGLRMETDIRKGRRYLAYTNMPSEQSDMEWWSSNFSLMRLYATSTSGDVRSCCVNRLKHIYRLNLDPRIVEEPCYQNFGRYVNQVDAALEFGIGSILKRVLQDVGWNIHGIEELFDESLYRRLPDLFNSQITFFSQEECRFMFFRSICYAGLKQLNIYWSTNLPVLHEISCNIGMPIFQLEYLIHMCLLSQERQKIPGSWPEERPLLLVPGADFPLWPVHGKAHGQAIHMAMWPCIQEILAEEGYKIEVFDKQNTSPPRIEGYQVWRLGECLCDNRFEEVLEFW